MGGSDSSGSDKQAGAFCGCCWCDREGEGEEGCRGRSTKYTRSGEGQAGRYFRFLDETRATRKDAGSFQTQVGATTTQEVGKVGR